MASVEFARYPVTIDGETVHVGTAGELVVVLDVLQGRHDRVVLEQLAPHLARIIGGPSGLMITIKSLSPEDQVFLINTLGPSVNELVGTAGNLRDLLAVLANPAVEEPLLAALGSAGLGQLILAATDLSEVLEWVYGRCDQMILELLGAERLRRLVTSGGELSLVLHSLDVERQAWLLEQLGWERVLALVANGRDLAYLLGALPPRLSERLLEHYPRELLVALIGNARDWEFLYRRLEPAESARLCTLLGVDDNA